MTIFIILFSLALSGIANSQMDIIEYAPTQAWFNSIWWTKINPTKNWFMKHPFAFALDGWHFMKTLRILFVLIPIAYLLSSTITSFLIIEILLYILEGLFFELGFNFLRKK